MSREIALPDATFAFAKKIGDPWSDPGGFELQDFQSRFLYMQLLGAAQTAEAYWLLHSKKIFSGCNILARHLLERIINSRIAKISSEHATKLIVHELDKEVEATEKRFAAYGDLGVEDVQFLESLKKDQAMFHNLLGRAPTKDWNFYERFKEAKLGVLYRSAYSYLSGYVHASYRTPEEAKNPPAETSDYFALMGPIETALHLHRLSCPGANCPLDEEYGEVARAISIACFGSPPPQGA